MMKTLNPQTKSDPGATGSSHAPPWHTFTKTPAAHFFLMIAMAAVAGVPPRC
jgi:hypothetical protein